MTKIITRYFDSVDQARSVTQELVNMQQFSPKILDLYEGTEGLVEALTAAHVDAATAQAYQDRLASGGAVLLVRAGYKPLNVARTTREVTAAMGAADMGDLVEEVYVKDDVRRPSSILRDHPLILTKRRSPGSTNYYMANWPIPLVIRRKPFTRRVGRVMGPWTGYPFPLLSDRKPFTGSIFSRHARMANWPIPLISRRKPFTGSIIGRHARMANFPIPLISRRKLYSGTLIGRHTRMANWPFPLLMNGERGTNALIPGNPRMANFPIPLLSGRKPFTGSIFPRHARMAAFPIPLISRRKPYTGSIIPKHARMADVILPLTIKRGDATQPDAGQRNSLSRMLGWPTIIKR